MPDPLISRTESAYTYPLLIKNLLQFPLVNCPDQEIVYRDQLRYSYKTLHQRVCRLANALIDMGVKPGDTVAVMDWDSHRYLECFFAVPMIGAVLHTVNVKLSPEQILYTIDHAEDDVLFIHSDFIPIIEQIKGRIATVREYILLKDSDDSFVSQIPFSGDYESWILMKIAVRQRSTPPEQLGCRKGSRKGSILAIVNWFCTHSVFWLLLVRPKRRGECIKVMSICPSRRCSMFMHGVCLMWQLLSE